MRQRIYAYLICVALIGIGYFYSNSLQFKQETEAEILTKGVVLAVEEIKLTDEDAESIFNDKQWAVKVRITKGIYKGREIDTVHYEEDNPAYSFMVYPGNEVVLSLDVEDYVLKNAYISGLARDRYLFYLFAVFVVSILLIGARQGVKTVLSLFLTGWAVIKILLPAILTGKNPISVTIIVSAGITVVTLMLVSGFTRKSLSAISGTIIGISLAGIIANYFIEITKISGLASEESRLFFFSYAEGRIDITGLLFAGIVIGALGAVMDVAMSIASSVCEIHGTNPDLSLSRLVKSGLNIGRDIIGTMANTLILAYTGGALPLMLLIMANDIPYVKYINLDMIASEIVRALAGSIGLFLAVPFTAFISAVLCKNARSLSHIKVPRGRQQS